MESELNFHHLRYFWAVAKDGNLTRTAKRLRVSQSAISNQIRQLEDRLGAALFHRESRRLALTEAGRIALHYAEDIFSTGDELMATLAEGRRREERLRLGAVATMSRNFQESFVRPLLDDPTMQLSLLSGRFDDLLDSLAAHELDLVLANRPPRRPGAWHCREVARQGISVVGRPRAVPFRYPDDLVSAPIILPGPDSDVRSRFDALCDRLEISVNMLAEVDDMATMRLLAREATEAIALLPSVVVRDELIAGQLHEHCVVPNLFEAFYAVTIERHFPHPRLAELLARDQAELLAMEPAEAS